MNTQKKRSKASGILIWALQAITALVFLSGGLYTLALPIGTLAAQMSYANHFPEWMVRFISISEILGALGLLLPSILRIRPVLTPLAAVGLTLVMVFATIYHITHNEANQAPMTIILGTLTGIIAWARSKKIIINDRAAFRLR